MVMAGGSPFSHTPAAAAAPRSRPFRVQGMSGVQDVQCGGQPGGGRGQAHPNFTHSTATGCSAAAAAGDVKMGHYPTSNTSPPLTLPTTTEPNTAATAKSPKF